MQLYIRQSDTVEGSDDDGDISMPVRKLCCRYSTCRPPEPTSSCTSRAGTSPLNRLLFRYSCPTPARSGDSWPQNRL
uniref:Uncharacterized protein n=1 Tax=Zea mays TaxID=4577 RepID=C4IYL5_MAIZE|nr:unknown [Zea mays]